MTSKGLPATPLPAEAKLGWSGQSQQFKEASGGIIVTFVLALLIVFLVLAAQFESFVHPLVIMLSVPLALAGAVYALYFTGLSLNLYSQIGIAADRAHGQERHPHRRVRQPAAQ